MTLASRTRTPLIVVGLGYGDEAKGATVDALAASIPDTVAVARWSGGAQAAHNVVHGPRHHTFRQFGAATLLDVQTFLMAPMMLDPLMLAVEAHELAQLGITNPLSLLTVDAACLVTTPVHRALNRARELERGTARHGSCGLGIGETVVYDLACRAGAHAGDLIGNFAAPGNVVPGAQALTAGTLDDKLSTIRALDELLAYAAPLIESVDDPDGLLDFGTVHSIAVEMQRIASDLRIMNGNAHVFDALHSGTVIFEGSQGVLLDENRGFHPHTTWATTTPLALRSTLRQAGFEPYTLGLTRSYSTRHGAGPMPTESDTVTVTEPHNGTEIFQGAWRQGHLDLVALRYAAAASGGVDGIGVSHLDHIQPDVVTSWGPGYDDTLMGLTASPLSPARTRLAATARPEYAVTDGEAGLLAHIEDAAGAPVVLTADGARRTDRSFR